MLNTKIATAYRSYLNASATLQHMVQPMLRAGYLSASAVKNFAIEHAHFYGASYAIKASGTVRFYIAGKVQKSANTHHAAQKTWQRGIAKFVRNTETRGGSRNKTSEAEKFLSQFHKMDAKDRREVVRLMRGEGYF